MRLKHLIFPVGFLALFVAAQSYALGQPTSRTLTVWLIPLELADESTTEDIDEFNKEVGTDGWVTVVNTTCTIFREQLKNWNPEFDYPNFPVIKGQHQTLEALRRFARQHNLHINVRFVWWGQAFQELQGVVEHRQGATCESGPGNDIQTAPDIAQIGSTWVAYFAERNALIPQSPSTDEFEWRSIPGMPRSSLRYATDVRLIFYWKRVSSTPTGGPLVIDGSSWDAVLDSIGKFAVESEHLPPPMVMPIVLTPNLLHDYVPLVWSGGGKFLGKDDSRVDLTSNTALAVPEMLAARATLTDKKNQWHRLLAFPEISHEEAVHRFWNGEYLATIEPAGFIKRWHEILLKTGLPKSFTSDQAKSPGPSSVRFWDYAGVAAPPRTFIGGSDLIIMSRTKEKESAFDLARFLATDTENTRTLAELGNLPAQHRGPDHQLDFGVDILSTSLEDESSISSNVDDLKGVAEFARVLRSTLAKRDEQEYPALAEWPTVVESEPVLELLQRAWRRMGEGKIKELRTAASDVELSINQHINWKIKLQEALKRWWLGFLVGFIFLLVLLGLAARQIWLKRRLTIQQEERILALQQAATQERGKILALRLYRAKIHEQLHAYGARIREFSRLPAEDLPEKLWEYGRHIAIEFNTHLGNMVKAVSEEMEHSSDPVDIQTIVNSAYEGAEIEFKAAYAVSSPMVSLICDQNLVTWQLTRLPHLLVVILQEWLYNCLKEIAAYTPQHPVIEVRVEERGGEKALAIFSPSPIAENEAAILGKEPSSAFTDGGEGLPLIRDLLWYGFESKVICQIEPSGPTLLSIPLPLYRRSIP